ncbi:MIP family Ig-specific serine endopeptidase [[Mycoplasma] imitans]|uniref:MIP family Ig-specific serine endopeptidase n=1 Tax=[Mycoplasma] imitans TaxID=29560 RepID=UPI000483554E|nr:DUF31 family protein [[Mycoplasma] imitans]
MSFRPRKIIKWPLLIAGMTVVATTVSSCGIFDFINNWGTQKTEVNSSRINNLSAFLPSNNYKKIYDITFSFEFNNSGGYNPSRLMSNSEGVTPSTIDRPYRVFGTGWLFDWQAQQVDDNDPNAKWTGYFATNLHVAEALLNPLDNAKYRPSWYQNELPLAGVDQTLYFNLGKWDEDLAIKNDHNPKSLTYMPLSALPKTVYTATSFYKEAPKWITPIENDNPNGIREYIDFAVLAITLNLSWTMREGQKVYRYNDERQLYNRWIIPAMNVAKSLWDNKTIYNQPTTLPNKKNETDGTTDQLPQLGFFDNSNYVDHKVSLEDFSVYLGGYPYYSDWPTTPQYTKFNVPSITNRPIPVTNDPKGSPGWTINASTPEKLNGQKVATSSSVFLSATGGIRSGIYNADIARNFKLVYRNVKYKQYGFGFIIQNSNLSAGSSGSLALTSNSQALGIYFGTVSDDENQEASFGLVASLFNRSKISVNVATAANRFETDTIQPYDLIYGNSLMTDDYGSYTRAITTLKLSSRLLQEMKNPSSSNTTTTNTTQKPTTTTNSNLGTSTNPTTTNTNNTPNNNNDNSLNAWWTEIFKNIFGNNQN